MLLDRDVDRHRVEDTDGRLTDLGADAVAGKGGDFEH
jgi:hypothetical protein